MKKNITIKADQIFYLKDKEKIYTVGKTIIISEKYNIEGFDMTLLKDKMILFSKKKAIISDNFSSIYKPSEFEFLINEEILKGKKKSLKQHLILFITSHWVSLIIKILKILKMNIDFI